MIRSVACEEKAVDDPQTIGASIGTFLLQEAFHER